MINYLQPNAHVFKLILNCILEVAFFHLDFIKPFIKLFAPFSRILNGSLRNKKISEKSGKILISKAIT